VFGGKVLSILPKEEDTLTEFDLPSSDGENINCIENNQQIILHVYAAKKIHTKHRNI
jgi:hypothetical protein